MATARNDGAAAPRASSPTNDEAPAGRTAQGFREQAHQVRLDCRAGSRGGQARDAIDKRIATACARLALQGFQCHVVAGGFTVCQWGRSRDFEALDKLERFVELVCGGPA